MTILLAGRGVVRSRALLVFALPIGACARALLALSLTQSLTHTLSLSLSCSLAVSCPSPLRCVRVRLGYVLLQPPQQAALYAYNSGRWK